MSAQPCVEFDRVSFRFERKGTPVQVLSDFSIRVDAGEAVALVGPSGKGKSTVLKLCAGLLRPTAGRVVVCGQDISNLSGAQRAKLRQHHVGQVFQDFRLFPSLTALDNVGLVWELQGLSRRDARVRAADALGAVGMGDRLDFKPHELSGGQQQRVAIARATTTRPRVILADEPTGSLDADLRDQTLSMILQSRGAGSVILVTHDPAVAAKADRVVTL